MIIFFRKIQFDARTEKICLAILTVVIVLQYAIPYSQLHYKDIGSMYYVTLSLILVLLAVPTLANSVRIHSDKKDKFWGELSFLIYLAHWVLIRPYGMLSQNVSLAMHILYMILYLLFTMGLAIIIYWLVDRPMERFRHQWINKQA
jgi:peptidoglycan/LPS O-acetylase OafA/YrhL